MIATPEAYIATAPETQREALQRLLAAIRSAVPGAEEVVRRGLPAFLNRGRRVLSIGAALRAASARRAELQERSDA